MRFYRLEKTNYFKFWGQAVLKAIAISLLVTVAIMLLCGYKFMIVSSGSMEPVLPVGSLVIVTPCEYEDLKDGDIITKDAGGIYLTHRIIGKYDETNTKKYLTPEDEGYYEAEYWITKGDASDTIDPKLTPEVIVGKVYDAHAFAWIGLIVRYIRNNYQMLMIMLVILAVFVSVLEWFKSKLVPEDIECYEIEEDEE